MLLFTGDDGDGDYKLNDKDTSIIGVAIKQVNETVKYTANAHRQLHLDLSKTRKLIDRVSSALALEDQ